MFSGLKITNAGLATLMALLGGHVVQFTTIKMGDGVAPADVTVLTDLVSVKQSLAVNRVKPISLDSVLAGANLFGNAVTEGFYWREVGLFAKDVTANTPEVLFSYDNAGDTASYIPTGGTVTEMLIDLMIKLGSTENVALTLDSSLIYTTQHDLETMQTTITSAYTSAINTAITSVTTALNTHKESTSNPHSVTKSQVGLGNVANNAMATDAQATTGTATDKMMSPKNVKDAVNAYSIISDGNIIVKVSPTQPAAQTGKTIIWINTAS